MMEAKCQGTDVILSETLKLAINVLILLEQHQVYAQLYAEMESLFPRRNVMMEAPIQEMDVMRLEK